MPIPRTSRARLHSRIGLVTALALCAGLFSVATQAAPARDDAPGAERTAARQVEGGPRARKDRVKVLYGRTARIPVLVNDTHAGDPRVRIVRRSLPKAVRGIKVDGKNRIVLRIGRKERGKAVRLRYRLFDDSGRWNAARVIVRDAKRLRRPVPDGLDFDTIKRDRGPRDTICRPRNVRDCVLVPGNGKHVVVVGDSHARMFVPAFEALARKHDFKLSIGVVSSCPWQDDLYARNTRSTFRERCLDLGRPFYRRTLPRMDADVVVVAGLARSHPAWRGMLVDRHGEAGPHHKTMQQATTRSVKLINEAGAKAVLINSVMGTKGYDRTGPDPLECLKKARRLAGCIVHPKPSRPRIDDVYNSLAAERDYVATLDVHPIICPDWPTCSPVLGGYPVWRNKNHITAGALHDRRGRIWNRLERTGFM